MMKKLALSGALALTLCGSVSAQMSPFGANGIPLAPFCQQTITNTAATLASICGIPAGAKYALISVDTANIRYRDDGGAPTATAGIQLASSATTPYWYTGQLSAMQIIAVSGSPVINVLFYR